MEFAFGVAVWSVCFVGVCKTKSVSMCMYLCAAQAARWSNRSHVFCCNWRYVFFFRSVGPRDAILHPDARLLEVSGARRQCHNPDFILKLMYAPKLCRVVPWNKHVYWAGFIHTSAQLYLFIYICIRSHFGSSTASNRSLIVFIVFIVLYSCDIEHNFKAGRWFIQPPQLNIAGLYVA